MQDWTDLLAGAGARRGQTSTRSARRMQPPELLRSAGGSNCLLGKTWGYGDAGVWVSNGCGGGNLNFRLADDFEVDGDKPVSQD